jgi:RNA polymerase sigma-70 factor (ECF subfamily)
MTGVFAYMTRLDALISRRHRDLQPLTDTELVERFLQGNDVDVFEFLVRRYRDKVFALATSILGRSSGSEAEDATQEVFIVVYRQIENFRGEAAFSTWLYRVARNQIAGFRRRSAHRVVVGSEDGLLDVPDTDALTNPLATVTTNEVREQLLRAIDELGEPQKIIVRLFYWQDHSIRDIASMLEIEPNTIKSHLRRARLNLAAMIGESR